MELYLILLFLPLSFSLAFHLDSDDNMCISVKKSIEKEGMDTEANNIRILGTNSFLDTLPNTTMDYSMTHYGQQLSPLTLYPPLSVSLRGLNGGVAQSAVTPKAASLYPWGVWQQFHGGNHSPWVKNERFNATVAFSLTMDNADKDSQEISYSFDNSYNDDHIRISVKKSTAKAVVSIGVGIAVLTIMILISIYILRKCKHLCLKSLPKNQGVEDLLKNYESFTLRRYTYSNVAKITSSFREKIGEGGYGTVFKGKLEDGRVVAVKVLKKTKGNGQEFANEVVSICSTSHVNVVSLLGFCFEGRKGALLYEFMPNGSLEKFVRKRDGNQTLTSNKFCEIALGIARGLEYLHQDCNKRIVHFDIKPHNILLDADFTPKISDFGLAKTFKQNRSIISISGARGTAGYIAPEVFFSSYGGASHKSDVYSYGMMVLEMVGCTKRMDEFDSVKNSSEMYFPQWIYKQLEQETRVDDEAERKMVLVGLWCIQTNPGSRPSMRGVVGMLEGEVELEVPPMPCLASPPTQLLPTNDGSVSILEISAS